MLLESEYILLHRAVDSKELDQILPRYSNRIDGKQEDGVHKLQFQWELESM